MLINDSTNEWYQLLHTLTGPIFPTDAKWQKADGSVEPAKIIPSTFFMDTMQYCSGFPNPAEMAFDASFNSTSRVRSLKLAAVWISSVGIMVKVLAPEILPDFWCIECKPNPSMLPIPPASNKINTTMRFILLFLHGRCDGVIYARLKSLILRSIPSLYHR